MASSEDFFLQREKSEGKERLIGLVRFANILTETRRLIGERLRTTTCGC